MGKEELLQEFLEPVFTISKHYKTKAYNKNSELKKQYAEMKRTEELSRNKLEVSIFENRLEMIKSIHKKLNKLENRISMNIQNGKNYIKFPL